MFKNIKSKLLVVSILINIYIPSIILINLYNLLK